MVFVVLLSAARQMLGYYVQLGYERYLSHSFQFISHSDVICERCMLSYLQHS